MFTTNVGKAALAALNEPPLTKRATPTSRRSERFSDVLSIAAMAMAAFGLFAEAASGASEIAALLPIAGACISSPFGPRVLQKRPLAGTFHSGVDIPAVAGTHVRAVAAGSVLRVQRRGVGGLEILIQHNGFIGVYSHLGLIAPGLAEGRKTVERGEKIGIVGRTGLTYGPHLYFAMIIDGHAVDPAPYLDVKPCLQRSGPKD